MPRDLRLEEHGLNRSQVHVRHGGIFASFDDAVELFEAYLGPEVLSYFDRVFAGNDLTILGSATAIGNEAVVADAMEAVRLGVDRKAPDALLLLLPCFPDMTPSRVNAWDGRWSLR